MKNKICLVIPYFGKFKGYYDFFLTSCSNNPEIDWLIFTDNKDQKTNLNNIRVVHCTFVEFKKKVQMCFDYPICLDNPYKLCDFKVAYGEVCAEELKGYDFWGYCDCDLIFGRFTSFITDELLNEYDKLFTRGHLSLYRNNREINQYYKTRFNYQEVAQSPKSFSFDEWGKGG